MTVARPKYRRSNDFVFAPGRDHSSSLPRRREAANRWVQAIFSLLLCTSPVGHAQRDLIEEASHLERIVSEADCSILEKYNSGSETCGKGFYDEVFSKTRQAFEEFGFSDGMNGRHRPLESPTTSLEKHDGLALYSAVLVGSAIAEDHPKAEVPWSPSNASLDGFDYRLKDRIESFTWAGCAYAYLHWKIPSETTILDVAIITRQVREDRDNPELVKSVAARMRAAFSACRQGMFDGLVPMLTTGGHSESELVDSARDFAEIVQTAWVEYEQGKVDFGLSVKSSSSGKPGNPRLIRTDTITAEQQLKFLQSSLVNLADALDRDKFGGIADYITARSARVPSSLPVGSSHKIGTWVSFVNATFGRLRSMADQEHNLSVDLVVGSEPVTHAEVVVLSKLGQLGLHTLTDSDVIPNVFRGFYQYRAEKPGFRTGEGQLNLIDSIGTHILCHLEPTASKLNSVCELK
jgi:hypothetical protein